MYDGGGAEGGTDGWRQNSERTLLFFLCRLATLSMTSILDEFG